ncbi:hypothetical protein RHECNPAF_1700051 [Rhizobium etli CNPAF512]|nr:hypothetical protein RHECNPAF_1700051 [Rhizobium etli CNPAF512]
MFQEFRHALYDRFRRVLRRAQHLVQMEIAIVIKQCEVGEGAASVESQFCHVSLEATVGLMRFRRPLCLLRRLGDRRPAWLTQLPSAAIGFAYGRRG